MQPTKPLREPLLPHSVNRPPPLDTEQPHDGDVPTQAARPAGCLARSLEALASVAQALPMTLLNLVQAYSFAQLVCVDTPLEPSLVASMHLTGLVVMQALLSTSSSVPRFAIATSDVTIAMLCRQVVTGIYRHTRFSTPFNSASQEQTEARATALFAILLASFSQGAVYLITGYIHAAELVLFLPYPVLAGLLAVVGGMATTAAVSVSTGVAVTDLSSLNAAIADGGPQLAAAAGLAMLSLVISTRLHALSAFVLLVPAGLTIFYAVAGFESMSLDYLTKHGWLFPAESGAPLLAYVHPVLFVGGFRHISFRAMAAGLNGSIAASITTLAALMLKVIALESSAGAYLDSAAEMKVVGSAAMVGSLFGGLAAHPSPEYVSVLKLARASDRRVGFAVLALTFGVLLAGPPLMNILPRPLLGGMLMAQGFELCKLWAWDARRWIDGRGLATLLLMLGAAFFFGQTAAVFLGSLATVVISALRTSRTNALKYHLTGRSCHPPKSRPLHVQAFLQSHGSAIHIVGLEGFLFGGTVSRLARYVFRASERNGRAMRYVVLDLQATHGIEASACTLLRRLRRQLRTRGVTLLISSASSSMVASMAMRDNVSKAGVPVPPARQSSSVKIFGVALGGGFVWDTGGSDAPGADGDGGVSAMPIGGSKFLHLPFFPGVEEALEYCEDQLLALGSPNKASRPSVQASGWGPYSIGGPSATAARGAIAPATMTRRSESWSPEQVRHKNSFWAPEGAPSAPLPTFDCLDASHAETNDAPTHGASAMCEALRSSTNAVAPSSQSQSPKSSETTELEGIPPGARACAEGSGMQTSSQGSHAPSATSSFRSSCSTPMDYPNPASALSREEWSGHPPPSAGRVRPYSLDSWGTPNLPFAPSSLPLSLAWDAVAAIGSECVLRPGELLTAQGKLSREVIVVPPSGAELTISTDFGSSDGPLRLATMCHGGVFGVEGVLLALPAVATTALATDSPPRVVVTLSSGQVRAARRSQPLLVQQLLAASYAQQQDFLWMLARRTSIWTGGGHAGPKFDSGAVPAEMLPSTGGLPSIPSVASMPESFGRTQLESLVAAPWRVAEANRGTAAPRLYGNRCSVGRLVGLAGSWQPPADQRTGSGSANRFHPDTARLRRFGGAAGAFGLRFSGSHFATRSGAGSDGLDVETSPSISHHGGISF